MYLGCASSLWDVGLSRASVAVAIESISREGNWNSETFHFRELGAHWPIKVLAQ